MENEKEEEGADLGASGISFKGKVKPMIGATLRRARQNLGHPPNREFVRHLRLGGPSEGMIRAAEQMQCKTCTALDFKSGPPVAGVPSPEEAKSAAKGSHFGGRCDRARLPMWLGATWMWEMKNLKTELGTGSVLWHRNLARWWWWLIVRALRTTLQRNRLEEWVISPSVLIHACR